MSYEPDDGPLTDAQMDAIRKASPASDTPEELFTENLFESPQFTFVNSPSETLRTLVVKQEIEGEHPFTPKFLSQMKQWIPKADAALISPDIADRIRYVCSETYFEEHGAHPLLDVSDIDHSKSGRASGYVGMIMGLTVVAHAGIDPNVIYVVEANGPGSTAVLARINL